MQIPATAFLEMALDTLKGRQATENTAELKEFRGLGKARLDAAKKTLGIPHSAVELGYLIGLETARVLLQTMPAAQQAGIEI